MRLVLLIAPLTMILAGCATTQTLDAASIEYHLPRTDASTSLDLVLSDCNPVTLDANASSLAVTAVAGAQDRTFRITGDAMGSSRMARTMKIAVSDKGVITSINSGATDKTSQIIGDIVKIAATLAPVIPAVHEPNTPPPLPALACKHEAVQALHRYRWLHQELLKLRDQIANSTDSSDDRKLVKLVNAYAAEAAALRTGDGPLHLMVNVDIDLGTTRPSVGADGVSSNFTPLDIDEQPFTKWFDPAPSKTQINAFFGLQWKAALIRPSVTIVDLGGATFLSGCGHSIPLPKAETVKLLVTPAPRSLLSIPGVSDGAKVVAAVAQWQAPAQLCTDVGFGENRSIALSYDAFGRTTGLEWSSDAQAANITSALAGASADTASLVSTLKGASLAKQKAEIDQLSTQQSLNQWRACKEILAQGGYSCPQPVSTP